MQLLSFRGRIISWWPFLSKAHNNCSRLGLHRVRILVMKCFHSSTFIIPLHYRALPQGPFKLSQLNSFPAETKTRPPNKLHLLKFSLPPCFRRSVVLLICIRQKWKDYTSSAMIISLTTRSSQPVPSQEWQRLLPPLTQRALATLFLLTCICRWLSNVDHWTLLCKKLHFPFDCLIPWVFSPSLDKPLANPSQFWNSKWPSLWARTLPGAGCSEWSLHWLWQQSPLTELSCLPGNELVAQGCVHWPERCPASRHHGREITESEIGAIMFLSPPPLNSLETTLSVKGGGGYFGRY